MTDQPNVVLVTIDSLRADHCGFHSSGKGVTPTLDAIAEDGIAFRNAIAPGPSTPESMPVAFTGQWPVDTEPARSSGLAGRRDSIRRHLRARDTLPEKLQRRGYTTAAFTPNPFTSRYFGFDQGFDHFQDFMDERSQDSFYRRMFQGFLDGGQLSSLARVFVNFWQREEVFKPWESYYDEVIEWVGNTDDPFFLWVFLMDAHNPYLATDAYRTQSRWKEFRANVEFWRQSHETPFSDRIHEQLVTAYRDAIRYSDAFLERIRTDLPMEDTILAVHGDHGEAFGEHGVYGHEPYLYEENIHVPLVVGGRGPTSTVDTPVSLRALPELLCRDGGAALDEREPDPFVVARTSAGDWTTVRGRRWKYLHGPDGAALYDLRDDGTESTDRREDHPEITRGAQQLLDRVAEARREQTRVSQAAERL